MNRIVIIIFALVATIGNVGADTHYVWTNSPTPTSTYTNWNTAAHDITSAVAAASANDTVMVTNGTYVLTEPVDLRSIKITLAGTDRTNVVIDGNGAVSPCIWMNDAATVVSTLTITRGYGATSSVYMYGGGLLTNCLVTRNISTSMSGAGVYAWNVAPLIKNCTISYNTNTSGYGGGMYIQSALAKECIIDHNVAQASGGGVYNLAGTLLDSVVSNNTCVGGADSQGGGGILLASGGIVSNCIVDGNQGWAGGGILSDSTTEILSCLIQNNTGTSSSTYQGGGICFSAGTPLVANSTIRRNRQTDAIGSGGGIYFRNAGEARNCVISHNTSFFAAGVRMVGWSGGGAIMRNCTVVSNAAGIAGSSWQAGGLYSGGANTIVNTIIYGNTDCYVAPGFSNICVASGTLNATNCLFSPLGNVPGAVSCIDTNPLFVGVSAGDFHLTAGSACIDAGLYESWMTNAVDLDGRIRIRYGAVDMGAYEFLREGAIFGFH